MDGSRAADMIKVNCHDFSISIRDSFALMKADFKNTAATPEDELNFRDEETRLICDTQVSHFVSKSVSKRARVKKKKRFEKFECDGVQHSVCAKSFVVDVRQFNRRLYIVADVVVEWGSALYTLCTIIYQLRRKVLSAFYYQFCDL